MTALTCKRADLAWALKAVLPHVCRDTFIESLCGIRLEVVPAEKTLYCIATDRYTLGAAMVPIEGDCEPVEATMPTREVRDLLRKLPDRDKNAEAALELAGEHVELDGFYRFRVLPTPPSIPGMSPNGWVKWRSLIGPMLRYPAAAPADDITYTAGYLGRFTLASCDAAGVTVLPVQSNRENSKAAMTLVLAENFAGAIMGRRDGANASRLSRWCSLIPASEGKP